MKSIKLPLLTGALALLLAACSTQQNLCGEGAGNVQDEALCVGRTADSLKGSAEDYFADMDYGISKDPVDDRW